MTAFYALQRNWLTWNGAKLEKPDDLMVFAVFLCFGAFIGALCSIAAPKSTPWWQRLVILLAVIALMAFGFFWV